jgi:microcystin-dependent protein
MSIVRLKNKIKNHNIFLQNRLSNFTNPPMKTGDLYVENNEAVNGNLDISGNLTVKQNLFANSYYATGNYYLNNYVLIPAGTIIQSASINEPNGWFDCDGRSLNIDIYSYLFNAIGYTYGGSDTSFNIPDIRGRVCVGAGLGNTLTRRNLGSIGGEENHTMTVNEIPSHTHSGTTNASGTHTHSSNANGGTYGLAYSDGNNTVTSADVTSEELNVWTPPVALTINSDGNHSHTFTTDSTGSGTSHNNMQPFIVMRYLIKY